MPVSFMIFIIIFILIFLAIYFFQIKSTRGIEHTQETGKKVEAEAAEPGKSAVRPDEHVDPFKSAVPPKE
jgi:hypothetical protein